MKSESEIRGVLLMFLNMYGGPNWDVITQTCKDYGLNTIVGEFTTVQSTLYDSAYVRHVGSGRDDLALALTAAHARGLKLWVLDDTVYGLGSYQDPLLLGAVHWNPDTQQLEQTGATCPTKAHDHILNLIRELITTHPDIDGFMFDFIRYEADSNYCYCPQCKAAFEAYLGEGVITNWPGDFAEDASRWFEFVEWRTIPVTNLVKEGSQILRNAKPSIVISAAVWTYGGDCPIYWRKYIGQDTGLWIKEGYIDLVSPMIYECEAQTPGQSLNTIANQIDTNNRYMVAGPEGKILQVPFLRWDWSRTSVPAMPPEEFKAQVDLVRSKGCDGWIIFRYGGPEDSAGSDAADIRTTLSLIDMPTTFSLDNIRWSKTATNLIVEWETEIPTIGRVEASKLPLFTSEFEQWRGDIFSWNTKYHSGTIFAEASPTTTHRIEVPLSEVAYFRVQSQETMIATSPVYSIGEVPPQGPTTPFSEQLEEGVYEISVPSVVTVTPDMYNFKQWEDGSTNPVRTINLTSDMAITATYELLAPPPPGYHHLAIVAQNGTTNPTVGIYEVVDGTTVQVTAKPNTGYLFKHWLFDNVIAGTDPTIAVTMDADHTLLAVFVPWEAPPTPPIEPLFPRVREITSAFPRIAGIYTRIDEIRLKRVEGET